MKKIRCKECGHKIATVERELVAGRVSRKLYSSKRHAGLLKEDRLYLVLDALERAKESGVTIKYNDFMRKVLYGYDS